MSLPQPDADPAAASSLRVGAVGLRLYHHDTGGVPPELPDRGDLMQAIGPLLGARLDPADGSYWVIRRLNVRFRAPADPGAAHLAGEFARQLTAAMQRVLAGEIVDGVRRYDSRAHWLADCLWALDGGGASLSWQFGRYRPHADLPVGEAIRLTVQKEPQAAAAALALLSRDRRLRLLSTRMGEGACRAVLRSILPTKGRGARDVSNPLQQVLREELSLAPQSRYRAALCAVARQIDEGQETALPGIAVVEQLLRRGVAARPRLLPDRAQRLPGAQRDTTTAVLPSQAPPQRLSLPRPAKFAARVSATAGQASGLETGFAGVFVLWRSVMEMNLLSLLPGGAAAGPARLALAAALTGPAHSAAWADPALHWLCDHQPEDGSVAPLPPAGLERRFVEHIREWRAPRPVTPTRTKVGRSHVVQDRQTEDWLWVGDQAGLCRVEKQLGTCCGLPEPGARDPAVDLAWFGVAHSRARRPWVLLARAAYGDFARRLNGLQGASAAWTWDRLLAGWGVLEPGDPARMILPRVPLDLVLRMSAANGAVIAAPGGAVQLSLPGAG